MPIKPNLYGKFTCGRCGFSEFIDFGDPDDYTVPDIESWVCSACGAEERFVQPPAAG